MQNDKQNKVTDSDAGRTGQPQRYIIVAAGEGAGIQVTTGDIHQAVHDSFCCCEKGWESCATEFIKEDVRRLDNSDEWSTDEDGREFSLTYEGEQYSLAVYKDWNYKAAALPEGAEPPEMELLRRIVKLEDVSDLKYIQRDAEKLLGGRK